MSSPEPTFERLHESDFFWLQSARGTIGFQATAGASLPQSPTLAQTWAVSNGVYVFLGSAPSDEAAFAAALPGYLQEQGWPEGPRFLWLESPDGPSDRWVGQLLALSQSSVVRRRVDFALGSFRLSIASGSTVALATAEQDWGFTFTGNPPEATLTSPGGQYSISAAPLRLPLAGATPGCWRLPVSLTNGQASPSDFERLAIGIRYFCPDPPPSDGATASGVQIRALKLPTLRQPASPLALDAAIDPLRPLASQRTHLSFFGAGAAPGAMESTFTSVRGHAVTLMPLAGAGAVPDARLALAVQPRFAGPVSAPPQSDEVERREDDSPASTGVPFDYYLTFEGAFAIGWGTTPEPQRRRLLCGTSGLEYLGAEASATSRIVFTPGGAAYTPLAPASDPLAEPLLPLGTTAWATVATDSAGMRYFAQPEEAPLFQAPPALSPRDDPIGSVFLDLLEVPALTLPADGSGPAFPLTPLRGLAPGDVELARRLEAAAVAPARRRALLAASQPRAEEPSLETVAVGVTPQGLGVGVAAGEEALTWLGIANDSASSESMPDLRFTKIGGEFRAAIQTSRLFMVLADADTFCEDGSVAYRLTAEGIAELEAAGEVPSEVLVAVRNAFQAAGYPLYENEERFDEALRAATSDAEQYELSFERVSGQLIATIDGWSFQLSPRNWTSTDRQSTLVFKLARGRTLRELAADLTAWSWPEAGAVPGGTAQDTQKLLKEIFEQTDAAYARTSGGGRESPYADVVALLDDPSWTGVIAFDCETPLGTLPAPLQALAAGIDPKRFRAHHVGFNLTPFGADPGQLRFGRSSSFGLIDYRDEADQYAASETAYAFKVLGLTVGFRNSAIASFASRVELLVNRLFGSTARLFPTLHGNNVILDGVYQRHPGPDGSDHGTYVFSTSEQNRVQIEDSALREVVLGSAQLVTTKPAVSGDPSSRVLATFVLGGDMRFYEPVGCDPFSFGPPELPPATPRPGPPAPLEPQPEPGVTPAGIEGRAAVPSYRVGDPAPQQADSALRFGGLALSMSFTLADPKPSFALVTETLSFDLANSRPREDSMFARMPLRLRGFHATPDPQIGATRDIGVGGAAEQESSQPPSSLGYATISAPVQQSLLRDPWYGLLYELDLGSLGALASSASLTLQLLVAWSAGGTREEPAVYIGVQLPGMRDVLGVDMPLQGVLSLGFRAIELVAINGLHGREYLLRFRNFALRVLGIALPPGHNDITLFANPDQSSSTKLGWYAAYSAERDSKKQRSLERRSVRR